MTEEPKNQLFRFLRSRFRAVGEAHRTNPRRHSSRPARVAWTEKETVRIVRARLLDISRAGAALVTSDPPPVKTRIRIRLVGREPTPWLEAVVLGVEPEGAGRHKIRIKFNDPCPTYFLRVAVLGPVAVDEPANGPRCEPTPEPVDSALRPSAP
jgi:hypothetical protein